MDDALVDENTGSTDGALRQAFQRAKDTLAALIHHCDHGSSYTSIAYNEKLAGYAIKASTGTVADSYDNALAKAVYVLHKAELSYNQTWASLTEVEFATMKWLHWWSNALLNESLDCSTPSEIIHKI